MNRRMSGPVNGCRGESLIRARHPFTGPTSLRSAVRSDVEHEKTPGEPGFLSVRDTGIEPVTSSVSGKRATAAPIAPVGAIQFSREVATGFEPV